MQKLFLLTAACLLPLFSVGGYAAITIPSAKLHWFPATNLPPGAELAILTGNPQCHEFYVARLRLPANFTIPAHSHITTEYDTVISGTYYTAAGKSMQKHALLALTPGSFIAYPAGIFHYGYTKQETLLEISGIGPWGTVPKKLS